MSRKDFHDRWHRRLLVLEQRIHTLFQDCRATGGAEAVHDLRVAIRRARLYAHLGRPLLRNAALNRFDAWGQLINQLLGPVRDCDVCMNWLAGGPGAAEVIQWVHEERVRLWRRAATVLKRRQADVPLAFVRRRKEREPAATLSKRHAGALEKVAEAVKEAVPRADRMTPPELHDLRRRLRRWRYLRELHLSPRAAGRDPGVVWLIKVQDLLGESQNLEMAITLLEAHPDPRQRERLARRARKEQAGWIRRARNALLRLPGVLG